MRDVTDTFKHLEVREREMWLYMRQAHNRDDGGRSPKEPQCSVGMCCSVGLRQREQSWKTGELELGRLQILDIVCARELEFHP